MTGPVERCAHSIPFLSSFPSFPLTSLPPPLTALLLTATSEPGPSWGKEAGMLALGAVATGCGVLLKDSLAGVWPSLLLALTDELEESRAMACWSLSRYAGWVDDQLRESEAGPQILQVRPCMPSLSPSLSPSPPQCSPPTHNSCTFSIRPLTPPPVPGAWPVCGHARPAAARTDGGLQRDLRPAARDGPRVPDAVRGRAAAGTRGEAGFVVHGCQHAA